MEKAKKTWITLWLAIAVMILEAAAGIYLLEGIRTIMPTIVGGYANSRVHIEIVEDIITAVYALMVGQAGFSLLWFILGHRVALIQQKKASSATALPATS
jgi:hypothetical protein